MYIVIYEKFKLKGYPCFVVDVVGLYVYFVSKNYLFGLGCTQCLISIDYLR